MTLNLTADEQEYLQTFLSREVFRIQRLPAREQKGKENMAAVNLASNIKPEMELGRVEVKLLQKLINGYVLIVRTMTLPEYDRRIAANPEMREHYQPYIDKHEAELDVISELLAKVDGLL